jgi:hypothetical protein
MPSSQQPSQLVLSSATRPSLSKESLLSSFAQKLAERYKSKRKEPKQFFMVSIPDDSFTIGAIYDLLNGPVMDPITKVPTTFYQELSLILKLGSECMIVYRDPTDELLIIYFKRLRNESLDSINHVFSVIQTNLSEFNSRSPGEYPVKLRLLLKDISIYMSRETLTRRISHRGQNRHYFIFNPNYLGTQCKRSICYKQGHKQYELNYQNHSSQITNASGGQLTSSNAAKSAITTITMPCLGYFCLFNLDFIRSFTCMDMVKLGFRERHEQILQNDQGEVFTLEREDVFNYPDYLPVQKKYFMIFEEMIMHLKKTNKCFYIGDQKHHHLFDLDLMERELTSQKEKNNQIEPWFTFRPLENKAIMYSKNSIHYIPTNVIDLPHDVCQRVGWLPPRRSVLGMISYRSQEEYIQVLKKIFSVPLVPVEDDA